MADGLIDAPHEPMLGTRVIEAHGKKFELLPNDDGFGSHRTHTISNLPLDVMNACIGFAPNADDDPCKVKYSWAITAQAKDGTEYNIAVWDYKGSYDYGCQFSAYGDYEILKAIFGVTNVTVG